MIAAEVLLLAVVLLLATSVSYALGRRDGWRARCRALERERRAERQAAARRPELGGP